MITTLFWDLGGVVLSNGWDTAMRKRGAKKFGLDWDDFQRRHKAIVPDFEIGRLTTAQYLDHTVFHTKRSFELSEIRNYIFEQSSLMNGTLDIVKALSATGRYLMATLNNESLELNEHRIRLFELRNWFDLFFSSSFLGVKKPDPLIYHKALVITGRQPAECVFIDDRKTNLEPATDLGMHVIHFRDAVGLRKDLEQLGIEVPG